MLLYKYAASEVDAYADLEHRYYGAAAAFAIR